MKFIYARVENNVGNGENTGNQHFLLFGQCCIQLFSSRIFKSELFCNVDYILCDLSSFNPLPHNPKFNDPWKETFENNGGKGEKLVTSIFCFSHNVFYPSKHEFQFFSHTYFFICKLFQLGPVMKFVVW